MFSDQSIYFQIPKIEKEGFVVQYDDLNHFYNRLHHHPEIQLIYIMEGTGDFFVGDSITPFESGNLFLIGSDQNHIFKSDSRYFKEDSAKASRSISIFFGMKSLGQDFFDLEETKSIRDLINRADQCIKFQSEFAHYIGVKIKGLRHQTRFQRFLKILTILNELSNTEQYEYLTTVTNSHPPSDKDSKRIDDVINYILTNYHDDISLDKIAGVANYSKASFCRFFKQRTRKTFSEFLNEVRISKACKALRNSELNISQICYESGFNNISNFNRQFKEYTGVTPSSYTNKCEKINSYHKFTN
jgi:AraC-like DNA-binding protein